VTSGIAADNGMGLQPPLHMHVGLHVRAGMTLLMLPQGRWYWLHRSTPWSRLTL
jgi:hypothetical protein